jgi:hypothetical protein
MKLHRPTHLLPIFLACAVAVLYFLVDPAATPLFPACPLHRWTGLYCAGCGSQRALHALLHGRLLQAAAFNVVFTAALLASPLFLVRGGRRVARLQSKWLVTVGVLALLVFTILRNLPGFQWLAPGAI